MNFTEKKVRRHPGVRGRRPDLKDLRRREALERQATYDVLTTAQKLELLEQKLSTGKFGAAKEQRARLLARLLEEKKPRPSPAPSRLKKS